MVPVVHADHNNDTISLQSATADPTISMTEYFLDDETDNENSSRNADRIILMSMHEIDPIEEQEAAFASSSTSTTIASSSTPKIASSSSDEPTTLIDSSTSTKSDHSNVDNEIDDDSDDEDISSTNIHSDELQANEKDTTIVGDYSLSSGDSDSDDLDVESPTMEHSKDDTGTDDVDVVEESLVAEHPVDIQQETTRTDHDPNTSTIIKTSSTPTESNMTQIEATSSTISDDDRSLLDIFAESAKVYLTQQMVRLFLHL